MVFRLDDDLWFPDPHLGESDGLIAVGGDLSTSRLLLAYCNGIFPWYSFEYHSEPLWYCPLNRFVIFPEEIHISHSMRSFMNQTTYAVTFNKDFEGVIHGCSEGRINEPGAWLGADIIKAYTALHDLGYAMSVEVWDENELVGGLYGVTINNCFIGESMFSRVSNASKLALIRLSGAYSHLHPSFIDCQFETAHLKSLGGRYISYDEYMKILKCHQ